MSYQNLRNKARSRFRETQVYLNYLTALEPNDPTIPIDLELKIMKGLFYVQLYSAFEKTVNELIETTLSHIGSNGIQNKHYVIPFNSISLVDKLKSFKDSGYKNFFSKAAEIFEELSSSAVLPINETIFSDPLGNVWAKTIEGVVRAFGINSFVIETRTSATINELVDRRNAVAHGRERASLVGERFRTDALRTKMTTISDFSYELIDLFENYYTDKKFLRSHAKKHYTITL